MNLEQKILEYCSEYNVAVDFLFEILEDHNVVPMIRGKATEYNAFLYLKANLDKYTWDVQKLNLNAQNNTIDEDVSITHRKTGIRLKVECKNAVRGSFNLGKRTKILKVPHFKVKCHRSRSNISLSTTTNDRYLVGDFDLLACNTSNALYEGNTIESLELINNTELIQILYEFYKVDNDKALVKACNQDWRFVIPADIAEKDNSIPRTPYVILQDDPHWTSIDNLNERLLRIVEVKRNERKKKR